MKSFLNLLMFLLIFSVSSNARSEENDYADWPVLKGRYFGQKPPGIKPEIFAPGIISRKGSYEGGASFSVDGKLLLFKRAWKNMKKGKTVWEQQIWFTQQNNNIWTKPVRAPFDNVSTNWDYNFAPIENQFYFTSRRKGLLSGKIAKYSNIWMTEFKNEEWTSPVLLNDPVNVVNDWSGYPSLTTNGSIYFHSERKGKEDVVNIYFSHLEKGKYQKVTKMKSPMNSPYRDFDPCIAPDESFMIFLSNRSNPAEDAELHISFHDSEGNWSKPVSIVSEFTKKAYLPMVSSDGKYIFFVMPENEYGSTTDIYWVDVGIIEKFRLSR